MGAGDDGRVIASGDSVLEGRKMDSPNAGDGPGARDSPWCSDAGAGAGGRPDNLGDESDVRGGVEDTGAGVGARRGEDGRDADRSGRWGAGDVDRTAMVGGGVADCDRDSRVCDVDSRGAAAGPNAGA